MQQAQSVTNVQMQAKAWKFSSQGSCGEIRGTRRRLALSASRVCRTTVATIIRLDRSCFGAFEFKGSVFELHTIVRKAEIKVSCLMMSSLSICSTNRSPANDKNNLVLCNHNSTLPQLTPFFGHDIPDEAMIFRHAALFHNFKQCLQLAWSFT